MELSFEKWEDGRWFVVLPDYDGDQEDLEMVDGADKFLEYLTEDGLYVTVDVSLEDDFPIRLKLVAHDEIGGTYQVENLDGFNEDVWLCNVVHFLFGEHPEEFHIYYSTFHSNTQERFPLSADRILSGFCLRGRSAVL